MPTVFKKLETDLTTVRLDFNDDTGAGTGLSVFGDIDLGEVETPVSRTGRLETSYDPDPVRVRFRVGVRSSTTDAVRLLAQQVASELQTPGPYMVQLGTMAAPLYFDAVGSSLAGLFRGQEQAIEKIASRLIDSDGLPVELVRLPYLYSAKLLSSANKLTNATLLKATTTANRPDTWAWDSTTGLSGESIDWSNQAYSLTVATTGTRNLQQTTPNSSVTGSSTYTASVYAKVASGTARLTVAWQGKNNAGVDQGAEVASAQTTLTTSWQRIEASGAANAAATKALVSLRFANAAATAVTVYLKQAQFELASAASTFRTGTETISNDPAAAMGRIMPVYVAGNARTRAILTITPESGASLVQARVSRRSYGNLTEFANSIHFTQAESMTAGTNTTLAVADAAASGTTARIWNGAGGTDAWAKRLRWQVSPTDKTAVEGSYEVFARVKATSVLTSLNPALYWLQLRWSAGNTDPVSFANEVVPIDLTDIATDMWTRVRLGQVFVERGIASTYGLTMELWARRESGESGNILVDHGALMPQGPTSTTSQDQSLVLSTRGWRDPDGANPEKWMGSELVTPTSGSATFSSGAPDGDSLVLNSENEAGGSPPAAGFTVATGRHSWWANVTLAHKVNTGTGPDIIGSLRVRNITDATEVTKSLTIRSKLAKLRKRVRLDVAVTSSAKAYQAQVVHTGTVANANELVTVHSISHSYLRTVTSSSALLCSGEHGLVSGRPLAQITTGGVAVEPLRKQGPWIDLNPGLNLLIFDWGEAPTVGYEQADAREPLALNTYNRACTVALDAYPRWTA